MQSRRLPGFIAAFDALPAYVQGRAIKAYRLWQTNPEHPSLHFKRVGRNRPVWSVRIDIHYRALGLARDDTIYWFWIGSHAEYDRLLRNL